ncbi:MAG: cupin domain-containing protein, partial [Actinomycetota bacterium]|nr:cupin domain-containing protein [Actinomycetota bacterium]
ARTGEDAFGDLLSLEDVDHILSTMSLRTPALRLVRGGTTLAASSYTRSGTIGGKTVTDLVDVGRTYEHFHRGASIVLQGLHRYWEPVKRFSRGLELTLTHPVQTNAYVTPPVASGLRIHHDTHDVFALQTYGRKQWVTYSPVINQPLASQRWSSDEDAPGEPELDVEMTPGDCLYLPRGFPHAARTVAAASVHLTIGVRSYTWHDMFRELVEDAKSDVTFRQALPAAFAHDPRGFRSEVAGRLKEMAAWVADADPDALAERMAERFRRGCPPLLRGQLQQLLALGSITDASTVVRRPGTVCEVASIGDRLRVELGDRRLEMPSALEPAVRRLVDAGRLRVGDLADLLDLPSRTVLVRRLVREALLMVVDD